MKMQDKTKITSILLLLISFVSNAVVIQPPPPLPPGFPIDGGVMGLFVAGLFYGIRKKIKKE